MMVMVVNALYNRMQENTRKRKERKRERKRESICVYVCVSACSSSDANASTVPFFLLDYAMKKDEAIATVNKRMWRVL
jgi:hypothetical protein